MDPTQMTWTNLCISLLERSRDILKKNPTYFIGCSLACYLPVVVYAFLDPIADAWIATSVWAGLIAVAFVFINAAGYHGVIEVQDDEKPTFQTLRAWIKPFLPALLMTAGVAFVAEFVGALLILPGLIVIIWVMFAGPITCEEGLKGWPAMDKARRFLEDFRWSQVVGALFLAYFGRTMASILPRGLIKITLMFTNEVPSFVLLFNKLLYAAFDVVVFAALSVWVSVAYRDITELIKTMPLQQDKSGAAIAGALQGLKLPDQLPSLSGFTPPPWVTTMLRRGGELAALTTLGLCAWWILKPHPVFEPPPSTLEISEVKVVQQPVLHLEGKITNNAGRTASKAVWLVKIPPGIKGVPPAIVLTSFRNGDARNFSVPLPVNLGEPEILPFRVEWSD